MHTNGNAFDLFCARWFPAALVAYGVLLLISALF